MEPASTHVGITTRSAPGQHFDREEVRAGKNVHVLADLRRRRAGLNQTQLRQQDIHPRATFCPARDRASAAAEQNDHMSLSEFETYIRTPSRFWWQ
jgi:hypothetical protein